MPRVRRQRRPRPPDERPLADDSGPSALPADPLDTSILFDVFALNQAVGRMLETAMRDGPLTPAEYAIYSAVFELESASPTRIALRLGMRLTTLLDQLRAMESRGHARRLPDPSDARSYRVVLTADGLEAHRAANRRFEAAHDRFVRDLPGGGGPAKRALGTLRAIAEAIAMDAARRSGGPPVSPRRRGDPDG
jgi:DNA-binding MarR family transcriptional regulator